MFRKIGDGLRRFMSGRYGSDALNRLLIIIAVVLILIGWLGAKYLASWLSYCNLIAYIPLIWALVRMYSRNIAARRRENQAYLQFFDHLKDKEYRYYHCPKCRQSVRVPRGKGKISIRCPKCGEKFIRRS